MRTLRFIVEGQTIRPDPTCDFTKLDPGTEGYLRAEFTFSKEWDNAVKVAGFYSNLGKEYEPRILKDGKSCLIPAEATQKRVFKIQILGDNGSYTLRTNRFAVDQKGG